MTLALSPVAALVRRRDPDRFLAALLAPAARREALFALAAFNYEVAKTREMVSEPMMGRMRLQWWRDSLDAIYEGRPVRRHEVVEPLAEAIRALDLSRAHFDRLIDAREADLVGEPPATLAALEDYAEGTSAPLVLLALEALTYKSGESKQFPVVPAKAGIRGYRSVTGQGFPLSRERRDYDSAPMDRELGTRDGAALAAGREIGIAYALAGLLRAVPFHARARRLYLPADLVAASGLDLHRDLFELKSTPPLRQAVSAVADAATRHLAAARALRRDVPRAARPALLPAIIAGRSLARLRKAGYDVFAAPLAQADGTLAARLVLAAWLGRY